MQDGTSWKVALEYAKDYSVVLNTCENMTNWSKSSMSVGYGAFLLISLHLAYTCKHLAINRCREGIVD